MADLDNIVNSALNFLKKQGRAIALCASLLAYNGCSKNGGASAPVDPNPPDATFMNGAVSPPDNSVSLVQIQYTDARGNTYPATAAQGQAIVIFDPATTDVDAVSTIAAQGGSVLGKVPNAGLYLAGVPANNEMSFITSMRSQPNVRSASLNDQVQTLQAKYVPQEMSNWSANDKKYLEMIRAFEGWNVVEQSLKSRFANNNVELAVIDVDFDKANYTDDITSRVITSENISGSTQTHGFQVATLAAATGDNANDPVGINWYSPLHLITAIDPAKTDTAVEYYVFERLVEQIGASGSEVANMSIAFGYLIRNGHFDAGEDIIFYESFSNIRDVIDNVKTKYPSKNFLVVVAAGNENVPMDWDELKHGNMLVVGASTPSFKKAPYSNWGSLVEVYVPGIDDSGNFPFFQDSSSTSHEGGTSFAAPVASGLASLIFEANPSLKGKEIKDIIVQNATLINYSMRFLDVYSSLTKTPLPPVNPVAHWAKSYDSNRTEYVQELINAVKQTSDGGFIAVGELIPHMPQGQPLPLEGLVLKLDKNGTIVWQKTYSASANVSFQDMQKTADGGFVIAGETEAFGAGRNDALVLKLNADGSIAWEKAYGGTLADTARAITETSDGGLAYTGMINGDAGVGDVCVTKLNADGSLAWQKAYGAGTAVEEGTALAAALDGGFIAGGSDGSNSGLVLKLTSDGSIAWQKKVGTPAISNIIKDITRTTDGAYVIAGLKSFSGQFNGWATKLDTAGNIVWAHEYASVPTTFSKIIQSGSGYALAAQINNRAGLVMLNADGAITQQKQYGTNYNLASALAKTYDAGFFLGGRREAVSPDIDAWLIKTIPDGTCAPISQDTNLTRIPIAETITDGTLIMQNNLPIITNTTLIVTDRNLTEQPHAP